MSTATKPILAWSYSVLTMAENCLFKYWAVKIGKIVSDVNQYNARGDTEHGQFEHYLKKGLMLPPELVPFKPMLDRVAATPGEKFYEYKMTLDNQFVPCRGNDWDRAWVRGASDVLIVNGSKAVYLDWKSGKFNASDDQIELTSLLVFRHFPEVQQVNGGLLFYKHQKLHPHIVHRRDEALLWNGFISRVKVIEQAKRDDLWPKNPNPLCGWCPVMQCAHNKVEERLKREREKAGA